jgi:serine/threonine-protein kinase RsbW
MSEHRLVFDSPPDDVNTVHDFLASVWNDSPSVVEEDRMAFELALVELTSNVIEHAADGRGVSCNLVIELDGDQISARLSDTAEPGNISLVGRAMPDEMAESGRGLALVQMLVDHLEYRRAGETNLWTISKSRSAR